MYPNFIDFSQRSRAEERMDRPDCDTRHLLRTVDQFAAINRSLSRFRGLLQRTVLRDMQRQSGREYHLVDLGSGGCDIPVWLLGRAQRLGLRLRVTAIEGDARIVTHVRERYGDLPGLTIQEGDALDLANLKSADYFFANHFLHHLEDGQIVTLLKDAARYARRGFVFSDLLRSRGAYCSYDLLTRICLRDSFARFDGKLSILKGFTPDELCAFAQQAGLGGEVRVGTQFPGRIIVAGGCYRSAGEP